MEYALEDELSQLVVGVKTLVADGRQLGLQTNAVRARLEKCVRSTGKKFFRVVSREEADTYLVFECIFYPQTDELVWRQYGQS